MKYIYLFLVLILLSCCTKQEVINTGLSSPYHDCSILEYMRGDDYNWKLTVEMIEHAGLEDLFEGEVDSLPEITFLGIPSMSVERFLYDNQYDSVKQINPRLCERMLLQHVMKGKMLKEDIPFRNMEYDINDPRQDGGIDVVMLQGNKVRLFCLKSEYAGVPDAGPITLNAWSLENDWQIPIGSPDIQPLNGVVHALNYNYKLDSWSL